MVTFIKFRIFGADVAVRWTTTPGNQMVLRRVDGDAIKPGVESTVPAEVPERPISLDKSFLSDVLGFLGVVYETDDETEDLVLILEHEKIEGAFITTLHTLDELLILFLRRQDWFAILALQFGVVLAFTLEARC